MGPLVRNEVGSTTVTDGDRSRHRHGICLYCTVLRLTTLAEVLTQSLAQARALEQSLALLVQDVVDRGKSRHDSSDDASHGDGE